MREAELWSTTALVAGRAPYPYDELEEIWRDVLAQPVPRHPARFLDRHGQRRRHRQPHSKCRPPRGHYRPGYYFIELATRGGARPGEPASDAAQIAFNAAPHEQNGVPAFGAGPMVPPSGEARVTGATVLENDLVRVELNADGHIVSLLDRTTGREVIPPGCLGNVLQLHPDFPNNWPAWDIDLFYRHTHRDIAASKPVSVVKNGPTRWPSSSSTPLETRAVQTLTLAAGSRVLDVDMELDWREHERVLKVALPVDVHADRSTAEIQFGHVERPTHTNTSWDVARFEYVAHRFVHVGEPGFGVAVVNRGIYGHEVTALGKQEGGRATMVRLTVVHGPRFPDHRADNGSHRFHYGIVPEPRSPTLSVPVTTSTSRSGSYRQGRKCNLWSNWTMRRSLSRQ